MAVVNTPNLISGRIGNLIYYVRDGKQCVRSMPVHDKKKHASAPTMEPVRRHNAEFSASSRAGAVFRTALGSWRKTFADGQFNGKVTSLMFGIVSNGEGEKGRRPLAIRANGHLFNRLPLNAQRRFASPADRLVRRSADHSTASISLSVSEMLPQLFPASATHFRWVSLAFAVPDFEFSAKAKQYEPLIEAPSATELLGEWMAVERTSTTIETSFALTTDCAHFLALALEFAIATPQGFEIIREASLMEIFTLSSSEIPSKRKSAPAVQKPAVKTEAPEVAAEMPVVQLRKLEEVPVELVLPDSQEELDLDFEPGKFEAVMAAPIQENLVAENNNALTIDIEQVASNLEDQILKKEVPSEISPSAEALTAVEDFAEVKPKRERKPKATKAEEEAPKQKVEKAEKVKADTGQLSLFF